MSEIEQHCKVDKRLDFQIQDLGYLQELLTEQDLSSADHFLYTTSLGETLKFVRVGKSLWLNEEYNITIRVPI